MSDQDFIPVDSVFTYDCRQRTWIKQDSESLNQCKLESHEISVFFKCNGRLFDFYDEETVIMMWCTKHHTYERFQDDGKTDKGCYPNFFQCYHKDLYPLNRSLLGRSAPALWRVHQSEATGALKVTVQTIKITLKKAIKKYRNENIYEPTTEKGSVFSYTFFPKEKYYEANPVSSISRNWKTDFSIPMAVVEEVQFCLQNSMSKITGKNVIMPKAQAINYWQDLWNIIDHPEDVHICCLKNFLGRAYDVLFFKGKNNYDMLCRLLNVNPPKSVRRNYLYNPYAIILYTWLLRIGFKDINAINIFMNNWYYDYMTSMRFDIKTGKIGGGSMPCANKGSAFVFYVRWMILKGKQEMPLARQLDKLMREGWNRIYDDMLYMFYKYYLVLPETTKELVKRRGISIETHNALARDTAYAQVVAKKIKYNEEVYALNDTIGDVNFRIIDNLSELACIGSAMGNCVASYMDYVVRWRSIIAVGTIGKEYRICIELESTLRNKKSEPIKFACPQALGKYNRRLEGKEKEAYKTWIKLKGIEDRS